MRVLRSSAWAGLEAARAQMDFTMVVRDCDVKDTLESVREKQRADDTELFTTFDIFEVEDGTSILDATDAARERLREAKQAESNMAILYFWSVLHFRMMTDGGTIVTDDPTPLSRGQIVEVLERLAKRHDYRNFIISAESAEDNVRIFLRNGKVETPDD